MPTNTIPGHHSTLRVVVAWLCLLLVVFAGTAELLHMHTVEETVNPVCSLCVVAHLVQTPAPTLSLPMVIAVVLLARPPDLAAVPPRQLAFELWVRPPPPPSTHA